MKGMLDFSFTSSCNPLWHFSVVAGAANLKHVVQQLSRTEEVTNYNHLQHWQWHGMGRGKHSTGLTWGNEEGLWKERIWQKQCNKNAPCLFYQRININSYCKNVIFYLKIFRLEATLEKVSDKQLKKHLKTWQFMGEVTVCFCRVFFFWSSWCFS